MWNKAKGVGLFMPLSAAMASRFASSPLNEEMVVSKRWLWLMSFPPLLRYLFHGTNLKTSIFRLELFYAGRATESRGWRRRWTRMTACRVQCRTFEPGWTAHCTPAGMLPWSWRIGRGFWVKCLAWTWSRVSCCDVWAQASREGAGNSPLSSLQV